MESIRSRDLEQAEAGMRGSTADARWNYNWPICHWNPVRIGWNLPFRMQVGGAGGSPASAFAGVNCRP